MCRDDEVYRKRSSHEYFFNCKDRVRCDFYSNPLSEKPIDYKKMPQGILDIECVLYTNNIKRAEMTLPILTSQVDYSFKTLHDKNIIIIKDLAFNDGHNKSMLISLNTVFSTHSSHPFFLRSIVEHNIDFIIHNNLTGKKIKVTIPLKHKQVMPSLLITIDESGNFINWKTIDCYEYLAKQKKLRSKVSKFHDELHGEMTLADRLAVQSNFCYVVWLLLSKKQEQEQ